MIPVDRIMIKPKKDPAFDVFLPPKMFGTFADANRYIRELQMLTFKGQATDVMYIIQWCTPAGVMELTGRFLIEFRHVPFEINLIDLVMRKLVTQVEQRTNVYAGSILKFCQVGDQAHVKA